ncbi:hypothetical protein DAH55_15540 [Sphingomonas koreensis]|jgi:hypothetical protein|uniref:hypothetical protein n=1 Tax=Sphingomonas koreensis TaxID=93064 RepID=UPI00082A4B63|nr:hypothetical protein [Sphingomonas koreensis]PJI87363.1 hypothetical protein BDW16_0597 [Sphingomonas koreensis]RSU57919.1 hypothetical protein DAH56_16680 [Sphingomonas koreensis]RSU66155.1 hypothetical protein DAH55_15540 [Sphingomonas koreensis]
MIVARRRPWTDADDIELRRLIEDRQRPSEIARQLGRTIDAIRGRAACLGLTLPSALRPWRRTAPRLGSKRS